jgi:high-affinity nickel-transport protein
MKRSLAIFDDCRAAVRGKIIGLYGVLIAANSLAWVWVVAAFHKHQLLLGTALIA